MDTHNIYLQMLMEIGTIGTIIIVGLFVYIIYNLIKQIIKDRNNSYLSICLAMQIYIILEGIVGNPIYDIQELLPYMIFLGFLFSNMNILNLKIGEVKNGKKD